MEKIVLVCSLSDINELNKISGIKGQQMKKFYIFLLLLFIAAQIIGCGYGYNIQTNVTPLTNISSNEKTYDIEVYWENVLPDDKDFIQMAFLEAKGAQYSGTEELLRQLKSQAMDLGADAIISVKQNYIEREKGDLLVDLAEGKSKSETYSTIALTCLAIRYRHIHVPK